MRTKKGFKTCDSDECYNAIATKIEYPQVSQCCGLDDSWAAMEPLSLTTTAEPEYWNLSLEEVVQMALARSKVLQDLGGAVLRSPEQIKTYWDPAIQETDPRFGVEAALSAFDAEFSTSVFGEKNDKALNNQFFGGGTRELKQDAFVLQSQITKRAATGSEFTFRNNLDYDANNAPSNLFPGAWNVNLETEVRQPLLQGNGLLYNRIAGPSVVPGLYGGVLIARVNTDVELADFELAVRNLISNIENVYWDLYFAYRDLDAKIAARDSALDTWRRIHALYQAGRRGGEAEKEAQAREQYFRFQEEVQNALSGRLIDGTRTFNGSGGGTFRPNGGVYVSQRRLRLLMGLPASDGRLIRPSDEPITAPVFFDWEEVSREAVIRRAEIRRQKFHTRRLELEWIASKNHLLPRLDAIGRYRWRGFGKDLLDSDSSGAPRFDNAYADLTSGDFQEWQLGLELTVPLGYRRAFTAVRNAELQLCRARALMREQEKRVIHDLSGAVAEMQRAFVLSQTSFNRLDAARQQLDAVSAAFEADKAPLDLLLEAQRRLADAQSSHFRALAEYAVAIKNVHFAKGTLLDYDGVYLSEGGWTAKAYQDAAERKRRRGRRIAINYASSLAPKVSYGPYEQHQDKFVSPEFVPDQVEPSSDSLNEPAPALLRWTPSTSSEPIPDTGPSEDVSLTSAEAANSTGNIRLLSDFRLLPLPKSREKPLRLPLLEE